MIPSKPCSRRLIDMTEAGCKKLDELRDEIRITSGMAVEIFEDEPRMLLSPLFREMLLGHAKRLQELGRELDNYLCVDYLRDT